MVASRTRGGRGGRGPFLRLPPMRRATSSGAGDEPGGGLWIADAGSSLRLVLHLRIVAPADRAERALGLLDRTPSVCNIIVLAGAGHRPQGDVILCDVAREDVSVIVSDLRELDIPIDGSIAIEAVDTEISRAAEAADRAATGSAADGVVWEEVEARTSEEAELSLTFLAFMVLAAIIAAVGIFLNTPILIVGAMVVGPEFGPIAGLCVAIVERRRGLALRSLLPLALGFPLAITAAWLASLAFRATGLTPTEFSSADHALSSVIASPDWFSFIVAFCAGTAGVLSLTSAKSGALIGVLISVTTIPAAANIGVSFAYHDWSTWRGSQAQLAINLGAIVLSGVLTLSVQRWAYRRRRLRHLRDPVRERAGLPVGRSRRPRHRAGRAPLDTPPATGAGAARDRGDGR